MTNPFREFAAKYIEENLRVFPLKPRNKMPVIPKSMGGNGCLDATTDPVQIGKWADDMPGANIGLATGKGLWVLDIDGDEGLNTVKRLIAKHGPLPETAKQKTPNGWHLFFKENGVEIRNRSRNIGPGLDVRSAGGYVVVAPSIHPNGGAYQWLVAPWEIEIPEAPDWLVELASTTPREREYQKQSQDCQERPRQRTNGNSGAYVEAALDSACAAISGARDGQQEETLNRESFSIGTVVGAGALPFEAAKSALIGAGLSMPSFNGRKPWTHPEIDRKVDRSLRDGMMKPRDMPEYESSRTNHRQSSNTEPPTVEPEPIPLFRDVPKPEKFPIDALGEMLAAAVLGVHDIIQAPIALCAGSVLAAATLAAQSRANVQLPHGQISPLSNYFITVSESGERKSAADKLASAAIAQRETELTDEYQSKIFTFEAKLAAWEKQKAQILKDKRHLTMDSKATALEGLGPKPKPPVPPLLTCNEPTWQGLCRLYAEGATSVGLFSDEGGAFVGGHAMREETRLLTAAGLSRLWDGASIKRVRAGDGINVLPGRRLVVHLMMQPKVAARILSDDVLRDQGLLSRFLPTAPMSAAGTRMQRDPNERSHGSVERLKILILGLLRRPLLLDKADGLDLPTITLTDEATAVWREFADHVEGLIPNQFRRIRGLANKLPEHATRLAGVLAIMDDPDQTEIDAPTLERGIALAEFYAGEALRLARGVVTDPALFAAEEVRQWIADKWPKETIQLRDIYRNGPAEVRTKADAVAAIRHLVSHGHLVPDGTDQWRVVR